MSTLSAIFSSLLTTSLILNAYLFTKLNKQSKAAPKSVELLEFLSDLSGGEALVRVTRVDPADVFLRSPRTLG